MIHVAPRPELLPLIDVLGGEAVTRIVGGAVRDALIGLPVSDIDLATALHPDIVCERLSAAHFKAVPTGASHGTITAVLDGKPIEVTTLRRDVATDGRRARVTFTTVWREDAARRDFTINALYADARTGTVFDYFDGQADLASRRIRFIGDPLQRIAEDHLRILRFFRFFARFGEGEADRQGLAACIARANDIMALSRERIAGELLKLLAANDPRAAIALMLQGGVIAAFMPEVTGAEMLDQLVTTERDRGIAGDPVRRLAALIGPKPDAALGIAKRLRLSKQMTRRLVTACGWTDTPGSVAATAYRIGPESARDRLLLMGAAPAALADLAEWRRPALPISGGGLIARGLTPGPAVAATLARIEQDWIDCGFPTGDGFAAIVERRLAQAE